MALTESAAAALGLTAIAGLSTLNPSILHRHFAYKKKSNLPAHKVAS